jgi:hypothetical protein
MARLPLVEELADIIRGHAELSRQPALRIGCTGTGKRHIGELAAA